MEAIANYAFSPTEADELGFEKGSTLYIIGMEEDPHWYKARQGNREGMVPANYISLYPHPWYIPKCSRREAEARLLEFDSNTNKSVQPDGAFVLRQSENDPGQFSISVKEGTSVLHFRVFSDQHGKYYIWTNKFNSINALIDYHRHQTIYDVKTLMLRDCVTSKNFGPVGSGPNAVFNTLRNRTNTSSRSTNTQAVPTTENTNVQSKSTSNVISTTTTSANSVSLPPGIVSTNLAGRICVAKFDFTAEFSEEMSFRRGDRLKILGEEDENWWLAEQINSNPTNDDRVQPCGLIPANYVELIPVSSSKPTVSNPTSTNHQSRTTQLTAQIARAN